MKQLSPATGIPLYTAEQIREVELEWAKLHKRGTYPLMERAGLAAFNLLKHQWPAANQLLVLVGKGNNGGDGLIVAYHALNAGLTVKVCLFCEPEEITGDASKAYQQLADSPIQWVSWSSIRLEAFDLIVDAMLGTGIRGAVREPLASVIEKVNQANLPVLAIDIPSGLNANTGQVINQAIYATYTITFIGYKRGLYTGEAANYRGIIELATLDIPQAGYSTTEQTIAAQDWHSLKHLLKPRRFVSHKGHFGHCRIIGGSAGMTGAAILAAKAAARSGAGLTSAWLESGASAMLGVCPEIMAKNIPVNEIPETARLLTSSICLVLGPGLGQSQWAKAWMAVLNKNQTYINSLKVIDADGLNWLAQDPQYNEHWVLTPHPGEAARLLGKSSQDVNADRYRASLEIAQKFGGVCVLKGAGTVISDHHGRQVVCPVGNPGMASGGMGDVLAGIIGGLLAQGFGLFDSAQLAVAIHGETADRAAGVDANFRGLLASDLFDFFPAVLNP